MGLRRGSWIARPRSRAFLSGLAAQPVSSFTRISMREAAKSSAPSIRDGSNPGASKRPASLQAGKARVLDLANLTLRPNRQASVGAAMRGASLGPATAATVLTSATWWRRRRARIGYPVSLRTGKAPGREEDG